MSQTLQ